jgi:hypothetical protein
MRFYKLLDRSEGIPRTYFYGKEGNYNVLVMDLLGWGVDKMLKKCNGKFSLPTVLLMAQQMVFLLYFYW